MQKRLFMLGALFSLCCHNMLDAHCQMPCGIYHDDMVFDQIDQYVETMYKGITVLNENKFTSVKDKNEFVRWVMQKEKNSDETALLITQYFLQQKVKPGEADTAKRLESAHNLLFQLVQIKQNAEVKFVETFSKEWDAFKLLFHREGYECDMEKLRMKKEEAELKAHEHDHEHSHDDKDSHDHKH